MPRIKGMHSLNTCTEIKRENNMNLNSFCTPMKQIENIDYFLIEKTVSSMSYRTSELVEQESQVAY